MAEEVLLTKEGKEELEKRLEELKTVKRKEVTERIKIAREFGDLSENAEYAAAKDEQALIEGEIKEIETKLKYAVIIKEADKKGGVSLGRKVDVIIASSDGANFDFVGNKNKCTFEIVGTTEADIEKGRISNESPVGNALLGRKAGEKFDIEVPKGILTIEILKVY